MNRIAALVAIVFVALAVAFVPASPAQAQPAAALVRLDIDAMSPRVVTSGGPARLVLTGRITNTGPGPVQDMALRVQRGPAVTGEAALRSAFDGKAPVDTAVPPFDDLGALDPGATVPFRYTIALTGPPNTSLGLAEPGTYPMLVNLNGTVDGVPSRLAGIRTVLPVSSLPGTSPPPPATPDPVTMLYPIADEPRRIPPVAGQNPLLTDDELATSFAPGGRLRGLVDALNNGAPAGSPTRGALCLAIDPELVATAAAMRGGYDVTDDEGGVRPGRGADAAGQWLTALQAAARGTCVVALPPADADLVALVRGGQTDLARATLAQGRGTLATELGTPVTDDVVWPADGVIDDPTLAALGGSGTRMILSADGVAGRRTSGVVRLGEASDPTRAVLADPLLSEAADKPADVELQAGGAGGLAGQDLAGALEFRSSGNDPVLVAPPHRWAADGDSAAGVLSALTALIGDARLAPAGLGGAVGTTEPGTSSRLFYPPQAGAAEIPQSVVATLAQQVGSIENLRSAAEGRTGVGATPAEVFDPLVRGTLRAVSSAWRGDPERAEREAERVTDRVEQIRGSIRVVQPPSPYSLGTSDAPLLITVANGLPVTMRVRVVMSSTTGLRVAPIPVQAVPPSGRVQLRVSAQVTRSGQFSVDAGLRTPDGAVLGPDTRLRVRSTVYGTVTVWLTAIAGAVLVVLVVRRIVRRIRSGGTGRPPGPDRPPGPGPDGPAGPPGGRHTGSGDEIRAHSSSPPGSA